MVEYGNNRLEWPEWLKFLVADRKRERRQDFVIQRHEVSFSSLGIDVADGPEVGNH
jgi:hypothetical protein